MDPLNLRYKTSVKLSTEPKLRSMASRCEQAARGLGLRVATLAYMGSDERFLYKDGKQVFKCCGWEALLDELAARGATIPEEYWPSYDNDVAE